MKDFNMSPARIFLSYAFVFLAGMLVPRAIVSSPSTAPSLPSILLSGPAVLNATFNVVAVNSNSVGTLGTVNVEIKPGSGRVLLNANPFIETDTQASVETAKEVAENISGYSLNNKDLIVSFSINGTVVGGPSAGAATTVAILAAIEGKKLNESVALTGTINPDGSIGEIGDALQKAEAVASAGKELFMIPVGNGNISYYEKTPAGSQIVGGFIVQSYTYTPKIFNINNYTQSQWGMPVIEVSSMQQVLKHVFLN